MKAATQQRNVEPDFDRSISPQHFVEPCPGSSIARVGIVRRTDAEQHEADLAVIERCERQYGGCDSFFACMGDLAARRRNGPN